MNLWMNFSNFIQSKQFFLSPINLSGIEPLKLIKEMYTRTYIASFINCSWIISTVASTGTSEGTSEGAQPNNGETASGEQQPEVVEPAA